MATVAESSSCFRPYAGLVLPSHDGGGPTKGANRTFPACPLVRLMLLCLPVKSPASDHSAVLRPPAQALPPTPIARQLGLGGPHRPLTCLGLPPSTWLTCAPPRRLGGIPVGVIAVETRTVEVVVPADPANLDSEAKVRAGSWGALSAHSGPEWVLVGAYLLSSSDSGETRPGDSAPFPQRSLRAAECFTPPSSSLRGRQPFPGRPSSSRPPLFVFLGWTSGRSSEVRRVLGSSSAWTSLGPL